MQVVSATYAESLGHRIPVGFEVRLGTPCCRFHAVVEHLVFCALCLQLGDKILLPEVYLAELPLHSAMTFEVMVAHRSGRMDAPVHNRMFCGVLEFTSPPDSASAAAAVGGALSIDDALAALTSHSRRGLQTIVMPDWVRS